METFEKRGEKLSRKEQVEVEVEYSMGEIDNKILELETELTKWKKLRREGEKLGLREVFNIPPLQEDITTE
jgi:hypothetical protein